MRSDGGVSVVLVKKLHTKSKSSQFTLSTEVVFINYITMLREAMSRMDPP